VILILFQSLLAVWLHFQVISCTVEYLWLDVMLFKTVRNKFKKCNAHECHVIFLHPDARANTVSAKGFAKE